MEAFCCWWCVCVLFFFFKQKTAYELRISDWSSDVCSSDLDAVVARVVFRPCRKAQAMGCPLSGGKQRNAVCIGADEAVGYRNGQGEIGRASCRERVYQYV